MPDSNLNERTETFGQGLAVLVSVVLCCTIVAVVTFAGVSYSTDRDERAEYYQGEAQRNVETICVGREGALLAECVEEQRRASRDAYAAEQDVNAQRQMAHWALWMFVVSAVTALLTLWALWYVRGTLTATREALDDTGKATRAMVEANRIAANAQRPWVSIEVADISVFSSDVFTVVEYRITFKNIGVSAAECVSPSVDVRLMGRDLLIEIPDHFEKSKKLPISRVTLLPDEEIVINRRKEIANDDVEWFHHNGEMIAHCIILPFVTYMYADGEALWTFRPKIVKRFVNNRVTLRYFTRQMPNSKDTEWLVEPVAGQSTR